MRTSPKALGTAFESFVVKTAQNAGLVAERLAEGGSADLGDLRIYTNTEWVVEAKNRERLNIHAALEKALRKSGTPDTAVVWKRMTLTEGHTRRHQDGPVVVALTLERFLELLGGST